MNARQFADGNKELIVKSVVGNWDVLGKNCSHHFLAFSLIIWILFAFINALFRWTVDKSNKRLATRLKSVWPNTFQQTFVASSAVYIANRNMPRNVSSNCKIAKQNAANYTNIETAKICGNVSITVSQQPRCSICPTPSSLWRQMTQKTLCTTNW